MATKEGDCMRYSVDRQPPYFATMNEARSEIISKRTVPIGKFMEFDIMGEIFDENGKLSGQVLRNESGRWCFGSIKGHRILELNDDGSMIEDFDTMVTVMPEHANFYLAYDSEHYFPYYNMKMLCCGFKALCMKKLCKGYVRVLDSEKKCVGACFVYKDTLLCDYEGKVHEINHDGSFGKLRKDFIVDLDKHPIQVQKIVGAL